MQDMPPPLAKLTNWPVQEPGLVMEATGPLILILLGPKLTDAEWSLHCRLMASSIDERTPGVKVGVFYHVEANYSRARATEIAEVLKSRTEQLRNTTAAFAYCTGSAMARIAVRLVFSIQPPPYPNAIVKTAQHGYDYLARNVPGIDPRVLIPWHRARCAAVGIDVVTSDASLGV